MQFLREKKKCNKYHTKRLIYYIYMLPFKSLGSLKFFKNIFEKSLPRMRYLVKIWLKL